MRHALAPNLEVHVTGCSISGAPDGTNERSSFHPVTHFDEVGAVVRIDRGESVRVGYLDYAPIPGLTPAEYHDSRGGGVDGRTAWCLDIHPLMPPPEAAPAEARDD
jgi:hypothetical protein